MTLPSEQETRNPPKREHVLEVYGEFACFTRPELSVERYSYPLPTPSAARGILESIYFKPEFRWQINRIDSHRCPDYIALRRNEVKDKISESLVKKAMKGEEIEPLWADGDKGLLGTDTRGRTQRQTMALRKPRFRIYASIVPRPEKASQQAAYDAQFVRRATQGKCFSQPALGCKEFVAFFKYLESPPDDLWPIQDWTQSLGLMLYDVFDLRVDNHAPLSRDRAQGWKSTQPFVTLFRAEVKNGVMLVPPFESPEVLKPEGNPLPC